MLIPIIIAVAALLVVFSLFIASRPSEFLVTRSATVPAPPDAVFPHVNDLHSWEAWSPWLELDPNAKKTYSGASAGVGAAFAWDGNNKVGAGSMTITESRPYELIRFRLDFLRPFKGTNTAEFTFKPEGAQTRVNWSMSGKLNFLMKFMHLFINCDDMVGKQFEKGLAQLNKAAASVVTR
jgi:hypothetical protein